MDKATKSKMKKGKGEQTESAVKKTGLIRFARSDRPLLRGYVTHLINSGYR